MASTCAPDARTVQVLSEAGVQQLKARAQSKGVAPSSSLMLMGDVHHRGEVSPPLYRDAGHLTWCGIGYCSSSVFK